jgi:pSer/pThr/pTyr-binding forkhead associated (FHA) protein
MEVKLTVVGGKSAGKQIPVAVPKFLIGRAEDCQLRPQSDLVSRHHCAILLEEGMAVVRDFGSRNGTFVNEERIRNERELKNGDRLKVGPLEFDVHLTVEIGGKKKPKVASVQEAAVRTVENAKSTDDDEWDIGEMLGDEDQQGDVRLRADAPTASVVPAPAASVPAASAPAASAAPAPETVNKPAPKTAVPAPKSEATAPTKPEKPSSPARPGLKKTSSGNSGDAAAETLRRFLAGRR